MTAFVDPTAEQREQALLVHHELAENLNRLAREGLDARILLAGLGAVAADLVTCTLGTDEVPRWFAGMALATKAAIDQAG